ncbi:hypothetical protein L249_3873 [Ophiocordyceps polyrhachis-furcata BCC 54312]|uniref:FHA domain-containing protein n=1 Tax=Ophiocordyceps polyrhachis-furcata BCC 54312 TaxID=1330021 RepID=A0A367L6L1_9HYPO|nr:hypothetical protein L249_3873 [Ophiocordyceps polyrhachis-furcata BCC 54312]
MDSSPSLPSSRRRVSHHDGAGGAGATAETSLSGTKRPASLLPAFEPLSSSPGLPRPVKRQNTGSFLPTPVPTSSTGILPSSPPRMLPSSPVQAVSERAPLSAVPAVELPDTGEWVSLGRSSNSSTVQLSSNRLISRVHVVARYLTGGKMEIKCNGWNGLKLHCQGRTWELLKGDTFTSETEGADVIVDVLDARVMIQWPRPVESSSSAWDDSPARLPSSASSLRRAARITSPESPTPARRISVSSQRLQESMMQSLAAVDKPDGIQIYEDEAGVSTRTEATADNHASDDDDDDDDNDPDEENDPIVHSFGPFGADIAGRMAMIMSKSPKAPRRRPASSLTDDPTSDAVTTTNTTAAATNNNNIDPSVTNHVVNQLAFSRLSSTPLSTIMHNLPAECKTIGAETLRCAMEATDSIGIIRRQGKDAAGKALESEYYYVPEKDADEQRRAAVVHGLGKPSLRACRKQHKYYWKRPRTP